MQIELGPTGHVVEGSIFDVNKKHLERLLKNYDKQLYLKWNPTKNKGMGIWELRRKSDFKVISFQGNLNGSPLYSIDYKEDSFNNHVKDFDILRYDIIDWLKKHDVWENKDIFEKADDALKAKEEAAEKRKWDNIRASIREDKKYWGEFKDYVTSGYNPLWFLSDHRTKK